MKTFTVFLVTIFTLIAFTQNVHALDKKELLKSLVVPNNISVGYNMKFLPSKDELSLETLSKNMDNDRMNPLWVYLYAQKLREKKLGEPFAFFANADILYSELAKKRKLTGGEIANWAKSIEFLKGSSIAIEFAKAHLDPALADRQKIYQFLAITYADSSFEVLLGIPDTIGGQGPTFEINNIMEVYKEWREENFQPNINGAKENVKLASENFTKAETSPNFGPNDYRDQGDIEAKIAFINLFLDIFQTT